MFKIIRRYVREHIARCGNSASRGEFTGTRFVSLCEKPKENPSSVRQTPHEQLNPARAAVTTTSRWPVTDSQLFHARRQIFCSGFCEE